MKYKHRKLDNIMLAVALFTVSGAILAYNLRTIGGGELAVSLSELSAITAAENAAASVISEYAQANLIAQESVYTVAAPTAPPRDYELLEPIVKPPAE